MGEVSKISCSRCKKIISIDSDEIPSYEFGKYTYKEGIFQGSRHHHHHCEGEFLLEKIGGNIPPKGT